MRNSACAAFNAANRSLKSGFTLIGVSPSEVLEGKIPQGLHARLSGLVCEWVHLNGFGFVEPSDSRCALSATFHGKHISL